MACTYGLINRKVEKEFTIRKATISDIEDLVRFRRIMFELMGFDNQDQLNSAEMAIKSYFTHTIANNEFHGWLVVSTTGEAILLDKRLYM